MASPQLQRGRFSRSGAYYAITTITHLRRPVFSESDNASILVAEIHGAERSGVIDVVAWVVMPDHLHLLLQLRYGPLSRIVQAIKSRPAKALNARAGACGVVWQPGFYDHQLRDDEDLRKQARYIIENPVRGGLVVRCEDYPHWWCRYVARTKC